MSHASVDITNIPTPRKFSANHLIATDHFCICKHLNSKYLTYTLCRRTTREVHKNSCPENTWQSVISKTFLYINS